MRLSREQLDRARGAFVGLACGDALGAPLEFQKTRQYPHAITMSGGGGWRPGEWTDDTSMSVVIAKAATENGHLHKTKTLDAIAQGFEVWSRKAPDVGMQTGIVMDGARRFGVNAEGMQKAAADFAAHTRHADGNGSLMRTAPVALACLDDVPLMVECARAVSSLTHPLDDSTDACVIWCGAIRHAVLEGTMDGVRSSISLIPEPRRERWHALLDAAEGAEPWHFARTGWVVEAAQAAWSAITCTNTHDGAPAGNAFVRGVDHAVRCGNDTDTVGAIASMLLGAVHGVDSIPMEWKESLHGWPGLTAADLVGLADAMVGA